MIPISPAIMIQKSLKVFAFSCQQLDQPNTIDPYQETPFDS